jgi:4-hydroxy-tetrahydrodipicolinate synthase
MPNPNTTSIQSRLTAGLFPAVPVPRRADGTLDADAQEAYAVWMAGQPVAGAAVWVHTGRGLLISAAMRQGVLRSWRAALGPERLLIAGAGASVTEAQYDAAAVRMAEEGAAGGADALLCFPPVRYRTEPARIVSYHRELAAVGLPLILFYLYEAAGGVSYSPAVLRELLALPSVMGIKMATLDSVMTYQDVAALIRTEVPGAVLITGEDRFLGYSLMLGARAALIGMGAALPAPQAALVRAAVEGDTLTLVRLTQAVDAFGQVIFRTPMEGYIRRMLWALVDTGVLPEAAAEDPDGPPLAPTEREEVRQAALALAAIEGERFEHGDAKTRSGTRRK